MFNTSSLDIFKNTSLDRLREQYMAQNPNLGMPDTYDLYKHKNSIDSAKSYADAVSALYSASKKNLSSYGQNNRVINNKGLQNSGYSDYIDASADTSFKRGVDALKTSYASTKAQDLASYASYLERYQQKQQSLKDSVLSHLIDNEIVDLVTATTYGINSGLSFDDAKSLGQNAYKITKEKITYDILKQSASLGLDREGAKMLAIKMGLTTADAEAIAEEVAELLKYYSSISEDYLEFLEQRSH